MSQSIKDIIKKGRSESADPEQRLQFLALFHRPELEFELKNCLLEDLDQAIDAKESEQYVDGQFEKLWHNRRLEIRPVSEKNQLIIRILQWAAILVVGLLLGHFFNPGIKSTQPVYYTSVAPKGSISEVILPEGSHIYLNSGSTLKYSVGDSVGVREIFLSGEALFEVAKIKDRPFKVHTLSYDVEVTGTTFDVKAYPGDNEVVTTLVEGSVEVISGENLKLAGKTILKQGEQLIYNKESNIMNVSLVNTKMYTSWKDNKLVFINMKLKDLKTLLERKYGVDIKIVDQSILEYHYDGTIKNETILEVLEILKLSLPIEYKIEGQNIVIQKKRRNI
jgi:ferric-dicitrate binding protein FerR (iron transport regulator)